MSIISKAREYLPIREEISFKFKKSGVNILLAIATSLLLLTISIWGIGVFRAWSALGKQ